MQFFRLMGAHIISKTMDKANVLIHRAADGVELFVLAIHASNIGRNRIIKQKISIKCEFSSKPELALTYKALKGVG